MQFDSTLLKFIHHSDYPGENPGYAWEGHYMNAYVYMYIWRLGLKSPLQKSIGGFKYGGLVRDHVNIYLCVCE